MHTGPLRARSALLLSVWLAAPGCTGGASSSGAEAERPSPDVAPSRARAADPAAPPGSAGDSPEAVAEAYLEALYAGDPALMADRLSPTLVKRGVVVERDGRRREPTLDAEGLASLAASLRGRFSAAESAKRRVVVLDQGSNIAIVMTDAVWGRDYIHLVRVDGAWRIEHIIWENRGAFTPSG